MTADLIKRLEAAYKSSMPVGDLWNLCAEAADELERLTSQAPAEDDRAAFREYLRECDDCAIVPDVGGAFNWAWQRASKAQPKGTDKQARDKFAAWYATFPNNARKAGLTLMDAYCAGHDAAEDAAKTAVQSSAPAHEPHGWIVWWPAMGGGHKPIYTHGAQKPSYGPELGSKLRLYPVYDAAPCAAVAPALTPIGWSAVLTATSVTGKHPWAVSRPQAQQAIADACAAQWRKDYPDQFQVASVQVFADLSKPPVQGSGQ